MKKTITVVSTTGDTINNRVFKLRDYANTDEAIIEAMNYIVSKGGIGKFTLI